jgi:long-chain acyl-CoA synthetase
MAHLHKLITDNESKFPEYDALIFEGRHFSNRALGAESRRLADGLRSLGVNPGDRVLIHLPNCREVWTTYLACARLNAIVIPTMSVLTAADLEFLLNDSSTKVVLTNPELGPKFMSVRDRCRDLKHVIVTGGALDDAVFYDELISQATEYDGTDGSEDDVAALIYTSGTTGKPKGVMLTHKNFHAQARLSYGLYVSGNEDSRLNSILMPLPLSHVYGFSVAITTLLMGNTVVMMRRFDPQAALELVREYSIRIVPAVPTMLVKLLSVADAEKYTKSVVQWDCGGSPMPLEVIQEIQRRCGGYVTEGWGLSETTGPVANITRDIPQKPGSVGPPFPGIEVRVVDNDDREVPTGQLGEFVVRGDIVMKGYWNRPEATARTMANGWLHTGDIGCQDADRYCYIVDRKDDLIIRGGENISPREIEEVLYRNPAIEEAAVVGLPDRVYGQRIAAFVTLKPGASASAENLKAFCANSLVRFKVPERFSILDQLPKNSVGKILKSELKKEAAA